MLSDQERSYTSGITLSKNFSSIKQEQGLYVYVDFDPTVRVKVIEFILSTLHCARISNRILDFMINKEYHTL